MAGSKEGESKIVHMGQVIPFLEYFHYLEKNMKICEKKSSTKNLESVGFHWK